MSSSPQPSIAPRPAPSRRRRAWVTAAALVLGLPVLAVLASEAVGWRYLAPGLQTQLSSALGRSLQLLPGEADQPRMRLQLLGTPRLQVGGLRLDNPAWSHLGPFVVAQDIELQATWPDLWRAVRGGPIVIDGVRASGLAVEAERLSAERASWTFDRPVAADGVSASPAAPSRTLQVRRFEVADGRFRLVDALLQLDALGTVSTQAKPGAPYAWRLQAAGHYRSAPLSVQAQAGAAGEGVSHALQTERLPLSIRVDSRHLQLSAQGEVQDPDGARRVTLRLALSGDNLADAAAPFGLVLPATPAFRLQGQLDQQADGWHGAIESARLGGSQLAGDFDFLTRGPVPRLTGTLRGQVLRLQDLGPALGSDGPAAATDPRLPRTADARLLPDRRLDLPSLRGMDADVGIDLQQVDLGHPSLKDIRPLQGRVQLTDGVLAIQLAQARLAQGQLSGHLRVDAQRVPAHWDLALQARGVRLEDWVSQTRPRGQPPYASGRVALGLALQGAGSSTAGFLSQADGRLWALWTQGGLSHLATEALGLDLAQAAGVWLQGDRSLPVRCGAVDALIQAGQVRPQVLLVDTEDSTLWATGAASLGRETLALQLEARPKDWSPLSLRTPIHLEGSFAHPQVRLDAGGLLGRAVPAALLAAVHPLAALLPLMDLGDAEASAQAVRACQGVARRHPGA